MRDSGHCGQTGTYLERSAEMLVLEGYRSWSDGILMQSETSWLRGERMFCEKLGPVHGARLFRALMHFVETLGRCAACPLKTQPCGSTGLCRDEVLILGLVSGLQYGNDEAVEVSLNALTCPSRCDVVALAAGDFALALKSFNFVLFPIPADVLAEIAGAGENRPTIH